MRAYLWKKSYSSKGMLIMTSLDPAISKMLVYNSSLANLTQLPTFSNLHFVTRLSCCTSALVFTFTTVAFSFFIKFSSSCCVSMVADSLWGDCDSSSADYCFLADRVRIHLQLFPLSPLVLLLRSSPRGHSSFPPNFLKRIS